jgi:hypothetical protein
VANAGTIIGAHAVIANTGRPNKMSAILANGEFEGIARPGGWTRVTHSGVEYGEIFTPEGWVTFFQEDPAANIYRPEVKVIEAVAPFLDPPRVMHGNWGVQMFKSFGALRCGLYQTISGLEPGALYQFRYWAHAWSNHPGVGPCEDPHDPHCSAGVGKGAYYSLDTNLPPKNGDPQNDAIGNFGFMAGVSHGLIPRPFGEQQKHGHQAAIYNVYGQVPAVRFRANAAGNAVMYIYAESYYPFQHSDVYLDRAVLERIGDPEPEPDPERGKPRVQYDREVILIHRKRSATWPKAAINATWKTDGTTVMASGDDAGIGDLDHRGITAVNPADWSEVGDPEDLRRFYDQWYPGVDYKPIEAKSAAHLYRILTGQPEPLPPGPEPLPPAGHMLGPHLQAFTAGWKQYVQNTKPGVIKLLQGYEEAAWIKAVSPDTLVVVRHHIEHQEPFLHAQDKRAAARDFLAQWADSLHRNADHIDVALELNEYIGTGNYDEAMHGVAWAVAFAEELHAEFGDAIRPGLGSLPVGNPGHDEVIWLLDMARAAVKYNGFVVGHTYWQPNKLEDWPHGPDYWLHYAGRPIESWDPVFVAHDVYCQYLLGELGVIGAKGEDQLEPTAGWKHHLAYNGDWAKHEADLVTFNARYQAWNAAHGNRVRGGAIFTSGWGWETFQIRQEQWESLEEALI